jgi:hypothetical protein
MEWEEVAEREKEWYISKKGFWSESGIPPRYGR